MLCLIFKLFISNLSCIYRDDLVSIVNYYLIYLFVYTQNDLINFVLSLYLLLKKVAKFYV